MLNREFKEVSENSENSPYPFNPPKGGFSSFAPRHSSSELDSALGLASVDKGGLGRRKAQRNLTFSAPSCNK